MKKFPCSPEFVDNEHFDSTIWRTIMGAILANDLQYEESPQSAYQLKMNCWCLPRLGKKSSMKIWIENPTNTLVL